MEETHDGFFIESQFAQPGEKSWGNHPVYRKPKESLAHAIQRVEKQQRGKSPDLDLRFDYEHVEDGLTGKVYNGKTATRIYETEGKRPAIVFSQFSRPKLR